MHMEASHVSFHLRFSLVASYLSMSCCKLCLNIARHPLHRHCAVQMWGFAVLGHGVLSEPGTVEALNKSMFESEQPDCLTSYLRSVCVLQVSWYSTA